MKIAAALLVAATTAHAGYACVDPADATARRWLQDEPCKLPMYHLPPPLSPTIAEIQRRETLKSGSLSADGAPEFFWRLPRHGYLPHGAPSAMRWR